MHDRLQLVVKDVRQITPDIRLFDLADADDWRLPPFEAGAHIDLHLPSGLVRPYSLCSDPAEPRLWQVAVKREQPSRGGSAELHEAVGAGRTLRVSLPRNHFPLAQDATRHLMIATGIGITPFLPMVRVLERAGADFILHASARTEAALPFADELRALEARGLARIHLTRGAQASRIDVSAVIAQAIADPACHVYACGSESLIAEVEQAATAAPGRVHWERFHPPTGADASGPAFMLELRRSRRTIAVAAGQSVLSALRDASIAVASSCEGGVCRACRVRVLEGAVDHRDHVLGTAERADWMMVCVSRAQGEQLVLDL